LQRGSNHDQPIQEGYWDHGERGKEKRKTRRKTTKSASKRTEAHKIDSVLRGTVAGKYGLYGSLFFLIAEKEANILVNNGENSPYDLYLHLLHECTQFGSSKDSHQ